MGSHVEMVGHSPRWAHGCHMQQGALQITNEGGDRALAAPARRFAPARPSPGAKSCGMTSDGRAC